jgi:16S rRNA (adenine1518-N6/adenine1519-N6)-dimethyltransferase
MARQPPRRKRFGQHFLEPSWIGRLVEAIGPRASDTFLEIGPGRGALTLALAPRVARLVAIEIDRDLARGLTRRAPPNAEILSADFLKVEARELVALLGDGRVRVAGNLPYNVSSPILFRLLDLQRRHGLFGDATLLLQREVVDRITAGPGTRDYGVLTVFVRLAADAERVLDLPPGAFRPAPRVSSALVRLTFRPPPIAPASPDVFGTLVRRLFMQRRKTILNALKPLAGERGGDAAGLLHRAGLDPMRRPETLDLPELARLADLLAASNT